MEQKHVLKAKRALITTLNKHFKKTDETFTNKIVDILYQGSLLVPPVLDEELPTPHEEVQAISHFCLGVSDELVSLMNLTVSADRDLSNWYVFKKSLMDDEEAYVMYYILVKCYLRINKLQ